MIGLTSEHRCLPRSGQTCPQCGEIIRPPSYCEICGADISPRHVCTPRPLPHICPSSPPPGRCLACGELFPAARFCLTCGAEITPSHRCAAASPTHVHRPDPIHICPSLPLQYCSKCGAVMPSLRYCESCGADVTPIHTCPATQVPHVCPPHLVMPHRCSHCGELMPASKHCIQCGADTTPGHSCK